MRALLALVLLLSPLSTGIALSATEPPKSLTPGAILTDITVEQICLPGYSISVRPKGAEWAELKREMYVRYGLSGRSKYGHVGDHYIPLELGGAPRDLRNLWPQPYGEAHKKDYVENAMHILVCTGRMSLPEAWNRVRSWDTALRGIHLTAKDKAQLDRYTKMGSY